MRRDTDLQKRRTSLGETSILGEAAEALVFLNTKMSEAKFPASGGQRCLLLVFEKGVFIVQKARTDNKAWFPDHRGVANIAIKQGTRRSRFPSAQDSCVHVILGPVKCVIALRFYRNGVHT